MPHYITKQDVENWVRLAPLIHQALLETSRSLESKDENTSPKPPKKQDIKENDSDVLNTKTCTFREAADEYLYHLKFDRNKHGRQYKESHITSVTHYLEDAVAFFKENTLLYSIGATDYRSYLRVRARERNGFSKASHTRDVLRQLCKIKYDQINEPSPMKNIIGPKNLKEARTQKWRLKHKSPK